MLALRVKEHLSVFEGILLCCFACQLGAAANVCTLQELEDAFGHSIVMAVPTAAHAGLQIMLGKEHLPLEAGEMRSLARVNHHSDLWLSPQDGRKHGLQREVGRHARLSGPADHTTGEEVDDDRQI